MAKLYGYESLSAKALSLLILTGVRTGELVPAEWSEINFNSKLWTIPASRMKGKQGKKRAHAVPLSPKAIDILKSLKGLDDRYVFPGIKKDTHLNKDSMAKFLRKDMGVSGITVHGFRKTLRSWVTDKTTYSFEIKEMVLAHKVGDATVKAYDKGELLEQRATLMDDWSMYLCEV